MDRLRLALANIRKQLGSLNASQKWLIGSLAVIILMVLVLVGIVAGKSDLVAVFPTATPEEQAKFAALFQQSGQTHAMQNGHVVVPADQAYAARAQVAQAQILPANAAQAWMDLVKGQSMFLPKNQADQINTLAMSQYLSSVASNFDGIERAGVVISAPETRGFGQSARRPTAQITVWPKSGQLTQNTVDALASMVAGSVAGLAAQDVAVIDAKNRKTHRVASEDSLVASNYMEHAANVEQRVQRKLADHLSYMSGVIVSVTAVVDADYRAMRETKVLPKNEGTVSVPASERATESRTLGPSGAAEPGIGSNLPMDINRTGAGGEQSSDTTSDTEFETKFGTKETNEVGARGKPLKINVIASVPRDWVVQVIRQQKNDPAAEPTEAEIEGAWTKEQQRLQGMIRPLVQTEAGELASVSTDGIVVTMIPVALDRLPAMAGGGATASILGSGGGGVLGGVSGLTESGLVKTVVIGLLAVASLGMMLMMVRKAGKAQPLPTAEELVGIPPALQPGSDVVGEADEGDTAMLGIEIGQDELKTKKMLEEVDELVKKNPGSAAQVLTRWLATEN